MPRLLLLVCLFFVFLSSCQNQTNSSSILRINISTDPATLDPRKARDLQTVAVCRMLFEGLTRVGPQGKIELGFAKKIDVSSDKLRYTFHLREGKWSDGASVTSFDIAQSWKSVLDPKFPADNAYQLYLIKNGRQVKAGALDESQLGIYTPDARTLVVDLDQPTPYFLEVCSMPPFLFVPYQIASADPNWSMTPQSFVGNGPFLLKSWAHSDEIRVVKNPQYWQASEVLMTEISICMLIPDTELQMFEEGKLDWAGSPLSTLPLDAIHDLREKKKLKTSPLSGTSFFRVNTLDLIENKQNPLAHPSFRKSLALSIDRPAITKHILQAGQQPAESLVPPDPDVERKNFFLQTNLEESRSLLSKALEDLKMTKEQLEPLVISFSSSLSYNFPIAQAIQKQWQEVLGIPVEIKAIEPKVYFQHIKQKNYQLALGSWIADFNDPINFLEVFKFKNTSTNNTGWEDSKYIDLLNRSTVCEEKERKQFLSKAEAILMDQVPVIPIFHFAMAYLQNQALKGVAISPIGQIDFRWVELEQR